mmetsp:Transcript_38651/g.123892  ORF Transcript_38651/g.123892 Transcript_38651/m.123892 type:complete len:205 (+) Transcript_38651:271-885(+)
MRRVSFARSCGCCSTTVEPTRTAPLLKRTTTRPQGWSGGSAGRSSRSTRATTRSPSRWTASRNELDATSKSGPARAKAPGACRFALRRTSSYASAPFVAPSSPRGSSTPSPSSRSSSETTSPSSTPAAATGERTPLLSTRRRSLSEAYETRPTWSHSGRRPTASSSGTRREATKSARASTPSVGTSTRSSLPTKGPRRPTNPRQ